MYIGESDDVAKRLKQHNQPEDKGAPGRRGRQGFLGAGVSDHQQRPEPHQIPCKVSGKPAHCADQAIRPVWLG
ncbi:MULTISPECIES: hypothetical protein [Marinobacter]|uniref:hypothetical protein n=1 Tax=Marinobacter TaxID=2742 RepID=UPI00338EA3E9